MASAQVVEDRRQLVHSTLHSMLVGQAALKFDMLSSGGVHKQVFAIPVPVKTKNLVTLDASVEIELPKPKADSLKFIKECGFPGAKKGTYVGQSDGFPVLPAEGLAALSYLLDAFPKMIPDAKEFLSRALSQFGKEEADYSKMIEGLSEKQISAGIIFLKVVTDGLSGLSGDLFPAKPFGAALERQRKGSCDDVMAQSIELQFEILKSISGFIR